MLPVKTLAARTEKEPPGMKKQKERITLMACSNATGTHKIPLMFVGKAQNLHCLKNVNKSALPVKYYVQKNAWVDTEIFADWFHKEFVSAVKKHLSEKSLPVKAMLLLGNAPAHPDESLLIRSDESIKTISLPPNTTDGSGCAGILETILPEVTASKVAATSYCKEGDFMITFVKKINVKDAVY